jgi:rhamnosyl/mannosyltransferase
MAAQLHLTERIRYISGVSDDDLPLYYQASDVFVLPSVANSEAFGLVQLEAQASGIPVVSTDLPTGVPFVNQDGYTGLIVPPKDSKGLAKALNKLLGDKDLRMRLGQQAQKRATTEFDIKVCAGRVLKLYQEVVNEKLQE